MPEAARLTLSSIRDFGQTVRDGMKFLRDNFTGLAGLYLLFVVPIQSAAFAFGFGLLGDGLSEIINAAEGDESSTGLSPFRLILPALLFVLSLVVHATAVYGYMRLYEEGAGRKPSLSACVGPLVRSLLPNFAYVLLAAAILLSMLGLAGLGAWGYIIMVILLVYLSVPLSVLLPVATIERRGFAAALTRSFRLVSRKWWMCFWLLLVISVVTSLVSTVMYFLLQLFVELGSVAGLVPGEGRSLLPGKESLVTALSTTIGHGFLLLLHTTLGVNYFNLAERLDATSLLRRLDDLGTDNRHALLPAEEY